MRAEPLGESAFLLRDLPGPAATLARALNANPPAGLVEAVPSYDTLGLYVDPDVFCLTDVISGHWTFEGSIPKNHTIPVCYTLGEDLELAASKLKITTRALVQAHTSIDYECAAIGFCPGFPYLGKLPVEISGLPRLPSPRVRVEPGSVAITGSQTGVYPLARPGGWWLVGRTPLVIVDVEERYFPIQAGDHVRFIAIDEATFKSLNGARL